MGCGDHICTDCLYVPHSPYDRVVIYKDLWYYMNPKTHDIHVKENTENMYYHCILRSIEIKHPLFNK